MPHKLWTSGELVTAADQNVYLQEQVIATFADAAERDAQLPGPAEGQHCWQSDNGALHRYTGGAWVPYPKVWSGVVQVDLNNVSSGQDTATFPAGLFTAAPVVQATVLGTSVLFAYAMSANAASAVVGCRSYDGSNKDLTVNVQTVAVGL